MIQNLGVPEFFDNPEYMSADQKPDFRNVARSPCLAHDMFTLSGQPYSGNLLTYKKRRGEMGNKIPEYPSEEV